LYNDGQTGIDDVRIATGNILPEDYPDEQITKNIKSAYSKVQLAVGRTLTDPFDDTSAEHDLARWLERTMAAMFCLKAYGPEFIEKVNELKAETDADLIFLQTYIQEAADTGDVDILMGVTPYLSYGAALAENPMQTTIFPYRSGLTDSV
jgi:hypothetical protein